MDCCTSPFIESEPGFWMTLSDVARIVKKTSMDPNKFCRFVEVEDDDDEAGSDEKYGEFMCHNDKSILMNGNEKCFFLSEGGCSIFNERPRMCRIYPFWFHEKDGDINITIEQEDKINEDDCLITKSNYSNNNVNHLLSHMDETEGNMKKCIWEYIEEMKLHDKFKHQLEKKPVIDVLKDNGFLD